MPQLTNPKSILRSYISFHNEKLVQKLLPKSQNKVLISTPKRSNNSLLVQELKEKSAAKVSVNNNPFAVLGD